MAFNYVGDLGTDLDRVRFYLQDTVENSGPKPSDGNFTDEEIGGLVDTEGSWQRAVAAGFETLASAWRRFPSFQADGLRVDRTSIADGYAKLAKTWRAKYGRTGSAGFRAVTRVDGYSDDLDNLTQ